MATRVISITAGGVTMEASLDGSATADAVWDALPITSRVSLWGDEMYFAIPVQAVEATDARATVNIGDVGYWPPGNAFCVFWGPTPMSRGNEIRPASPVNVFGSVIGDARLFGRVPSGSRVEVTRGPHRGSV
ncbi:MAG: hypothetical protein KGS10_15140 [Chloroflexi bacterium]|nr:hypothetical protein [Chloroflexota bacterium]